MTILARNTKDPAETLDYDISYSVLDLPFGDALASADATFVCLKTPQDTELDLGVASFTARRTKVFVSAGTVGKDYLVRMVATSTGGLVFVDYFVIKIRGTTA